MVIIIIIIIMIKMILVIIFIIIILEYNTEVTRAFGSFWLASLEVNSKYYSPSVADKTKSHVKSLISDHFSVHWKKCWYLVSEWYILKQLFPSVSVGESAEYLTPLWRVIVNYANIIIAMVFTIIISNIIVVIALLYVPWYMTVHL